MVLHTHRKNVYPEKSEYLNEGLNKSIELVSGICGEYKNGELIVSVACFSDRLLPKTNNTFDFVISSFDQEERMSRRLNEAEYNKELVERFVCPNFNHEAKFDDSLVLSIKVYRGCETFDSRAEAEALARKIADKFRKDFD